MHDIPTPNSDLPFRAPPFLSFAAPSLRPGAPTSHRSLRASLPCATDGIPPPGLSWRRPPCTPQATPCCSSIFEAKRFGHSSVTLEVELNVSPPSNINHFGNIATAACRAAVETRFLPRGVRSLGVPFHSSPLSLLPPFWSLRQHHYGGIDETKSESFFHSNERSSQTMTRLPLNVLL